jgi:F-type H+-transporting ATPase subunit gamma
MANLRDVRLRMRAIRQTLQVTKAMNLISTAKLRKGRRLLHDVEPYFTRIQKSMFDILSRAKMGKSIYFTAPKQQGKYNSAIIAITSDKGLAGGYNANIFHRVNELCANVKNPVLILIGSIGYRHFIHSPLPIIENYSIKSHLPEMEKAKEIAEYIITQYKLGTFSEVHLIYTHMYSSFKLFPRELHLLPLSEEKLQEEFEKTIGKRTELDFEFWPSKEKVFNHLVPMYIKGVIYGALVEAYVSEQSARMSAMDEATKSAQEMLTDLQINYNRARQAGITQEITEIVGGAETLGE